MVWLYGLNFAEFTFKLFENDFSFDRSGIVTKIINKEYEIYNSRKSCKLFKIVV